MPNSLGPKNKKLEKKKPLILLAPLGKRKVALPPTEFGPFYRRTLKQTRKIRLFHTAPSVHIHSQKLGRRDKGRFVVGAGATVPGTNLLTNIAAEGPAFGFTRKFFRNIRRLIFNGQVRKTASGIHRPSGENGGGGTSIDAQGAAPATIVISRHILCRKIEIQHQLRQKHIGTQFAMNQETVLTNPTESRPGGETPFEQGRRVHKHPSLQLRVKVPLDKIKQRIQFGPEHIVIILTVSITRYFGKTLRQDGLGRLVIVEQRNHR